MGEHVKFCVAAEAHWFISASNLMKPRTLNWASEDLKVDFKEDFKEDCKEDFFDALEDLE